MIYHKKESLHWTGARSKAHNFHVKALTLDDMRKLYLSNLILEETKFNLAFVESSIQVMVNSTIATFQLSV